MNRETIKVRVNQMIGIVFGIANLLWIIHFAHLFYLYHFCKCLLFLFMYPDWILIINMITGIIGIFLSILLFRNRLKLKFFLIIEAVLLLIECWILDIPVFYWIFG